MTAYADDVTILVEAEGDFKNIFPAFIKYSQLSGAVLNPSKSKGLW
jgi:hypothetical protein